MNGKSYRLELQTKPLPVLTKLYSKVFGTPPPSGLNKPDIIERLGEKYDEIRIKTQPIDTIVEEEEEEVTKETPKSRPKSTSPKRRKKNKEPSRRARIIEEVSLNIWDTESLAEALEIENPSWSIPKNKTAIAGTLSDLRKKNNWEIEHTESGNEKGRIIVIKC